MEACWKPGKSHRKLMRKTADSRTLGVSMASEWQRLPERRQRRARGARSGWTAAGARLLARTPSARSRVQPHKLRPCHAPSRPSPGGEGRGGERRGEEGSGGWAERLVVRPGGVGERGRGVSVWLGDAAPPRDARGVAGRREHSGPGASGGGRRARPRGGEEARSIHSARVPLALSEARSPPPPGCRAGPRSSPVASPVPGACGPGRREAAAESPRPPSPQRRLPAGASAADCALAPGGGGTSFPRPQPPGRPFAAFRGQPGASEASRRPRRRAQPRTVPFSRWGPALHKDRASVPDPRGQAKATSLWCLDGC